MAETDDAGPGEAGASAIGDLSGAGVPNRPGLFEGILTPSGGGWDRCRRGPGLIARTGSIDMAWCGRDRFINGVGECSVAVTVGLSAGVVPEVGLGVTVGIGETEANSVDAGVGVTVGVGVSVGVGVGDVLAVVFFLCLRGVGDGLANNLLILSPNDSP